MLLGDLADQTLDSTLTAFRKSLLSVLIDLKSEEIGLRFVDGASFHELNVLNK